MELVDLLKEEIQKLVLEDNINVPKLIEYTRIYERLRAMDVTTVQQVGLRHEGFGNEPYFPVPMNVGVGVNYPLGIGNELGGIFDMIKEVLYETNKTKGRSEIDEYIWWLDFLNNNDNNVKNYLMTETLGELWEKEIDYLKYKLYERTVGLMKRKLDENIEKEKQDGADKQEGTDKQEGV